VLGAAVVGRPDDVLGEVVSADVALRPGADVTVDELHALCAERPARYKRPVLIQALDEPPTIPVGKLDRPAVRALATA
jgi:acyl-CoA synthetase (AMP-forming)/AMP-acid ligase II